MNLSGFLTNEYVQVAVIISGLLTLVLLMINGVRYIVIPIFNLIKNGYSKNRKNSSEKFSIEVERSIDDSSYFLASATLHIARLINALATLVIATSTNVYAAFLYVPGYRDRATEIIILDMSPYAVTMICSTMLMLSFVILALNLLSAARFLAAVKTGITSGRKK